MAEHERSPRRRDLLKAGAAAGLLGATGLAATGVSAQDETTTAGEQPEQRTYSYSLEEDDRFRVRYRLRDPAGTPVTETVPAGCLGGEDGEEFQLYIVETYRDGEFMGYRSLLAPQTRIAEEATRATETTEAALQEETTTEDGETAAEELPDVERGDWYRVTSAEACDGMNRLVLETADPVEAETTAAGAETAAAETTTE